MQLVITQAGQTLKTIILSPGVYTVGRGQDSDICLNDSGISRKHAQLEVSDDLQITVTDLQSTNGTWLDKRNVKSSRWKQVDSVLQLGGCQLFLRNDDQMVIRQPIALPHVPEEPSLPPALSIPTSQPHNNSRIMSKPDAGKSFGEKALLLGILLLLTPFFLFLGKNIIHANIIVQEVAITEKEKVQHVWLSRKNTAIRCKLTEVEEFIANENYQSARDLLHDIVQKDPGNTRAITLQEKIEANLAAKQQITKDKKRERIRLQQEQEKHKKIQMFTHLKGKTEEHILKKEYAACLQTAKKILTLVSASEFAFTAIDFCSQSIINAGASSNREDTEGKKEKLTSSLQNILKKGNAEAKKKKYESALKIWSQAAKFDPDNNLEITKKIRNKAKKLQAEITNKVKKNLKLGRSAREKEDFAKAIKYFKAAHLITPSDKKVKQLYQQQQKDNYTLAEDLYHEAIAYASMGSMKSAEESISQSELLARGNRTLSQLITTKIADFNKR